jgi:delta-aminolevulinic acid dehydratase/porphobilinogen synthase/aryl carrier-like protein
MADVVTSAPRLRDLLGPTYETIRTGLAHEPFRRLTHSAETEVPTGLLCQSLFVERLSGARRTLLAGRRTAHYAHSAESMSAEVDELVELGIRSVYLQLYPAQWRGPEHAVDHFCAVLDRLRDRYGRDLRLIVDTAGLCMGVDLRWGLRGATGRVDPEATLDMLATAVTDIARTGADAVVTVGRVNFEAQVARAALDSVRPGIPLWAFSTNSETPNAYFDKTAADPSKALTGQKLLVGNGTEMVLRALRDCHEGVDLVLQKPIENIAVLSELRAIADRDIDLNAFLARPAVQTLMASNPALFPDGLFQTAAFADRLARLRLGGYEVSGTYSVFRLIQDNYTDRLARSMLDELYRQMLWASGSRGQVIVSRHARWYASTRPRWRNPQPSGTTHPDRLDDQEWKANTMRRGAKAGGGTPDVVDVVREVLASVTAKGVSVAHLAVDDDLTHSVGLDSLTFISFLTALERRCGVDLSVRLDELKAVRTLGQIADLLDTLAAGNLRDSR